MKVINLEDLKHSIRVANFSIEIARKISLNNRDLNNLYISGILHDIGKASLRQDILNKASVLTCEEKDHIKKHVIYSCAEALDSGYSEDISKIILHHHENFDGSGYPYGLKGFSIPLGARILKIADCFDALTSNRPYRPQLNITETLRIMDKQKEQYDKNLYHVFKEVVYEKGSKEKNSIITNGYVSDKCSIAGR